MIQEEKVILMTRMAAFTAREGSNDNRINGYFRSDYIGLEIVKSAISATVSFVILFAVYAVSAFESILEDMYSIDLVAFGQKVLTYYLIWLIGYCMVSYIFFSRRYSKMRKRMKKHYNNLRRLRKMYEKE
jgi:hypothetical protein